MKIEIQLCESCKEILDLGELIISDEGIAFCWGCGDMIKEGNTNETRN